MTMTRVGIPDMSRANMDPRANNTAYVMQKDFVYRK